MNTLSKRISTAALVVSAFALAACGSKSKKSDSTSDKSAAVEAKPEPAAESATAEASSDEPESQAVGNAPAGSGRFKYAVSPAKTEKLKRYEALFKPEGRIGGVVEAMKNYALPRDVPVVARECKKINAYYMPQKHAISLCYELAEAFYEGFIGKGIDDATASKRTLDAYTFTVLHEMGHALIAELDLGVSGGEEDNVDDLAALILIQNKKPEWAIAGPAAFLELTKGQKPAFFDEHSMSEQRIGNVLCMIYGSDTAKFRPLLQDFPELQPRAPKCPKEYTQRDKFWTTSLAPHERKAG
ncbi:MAG: DUF4344 domain-containing metallopeptidase [Polyangiaceae bacterium]